MSAHYGPDASTLSRIAERVMRDLHFEPLAPEAALRAAAELPDAPRAGDGVRDMRDLQWSSIDNPESRDLDQIEAIERAGAETILYVGIADVDACVPRGAAIDAFARTNTTSVYTGVRTFPMLPDRLSFDLTSLVEGKPRLAMVYATRIGADGQRVGKVTLTRALVENRAKLDYPSVSAWLEGSGPAPGAIARSRALEEQLRAQDDLARRLGARRREAGAIDVETGRVSSVSTS
ncbi:MAG: RNB domain-containing ribonuclease, partial [Polyangiaceae bacterium]